MIKKNSFIMPHQKKNKPTREKKQKKKNIRVIILKLKKRKS
jgi:hypothetical protein